MRYSGLGDKNSRLQVFMANRPSFYLPCVEPLRPLEKGELHAIGQACGNGWRKVFNVYAKLLFALGDPSIPGSTTVACWQDYRDQYLLQPCSQTSLHFEPPTSLNNKQINILMGRTYAKSLPLADSLNWLNAEFAIDGSQSLIVCPYFDYRQLSNQKIIYLVELIKATIKNNLE